MILDGATILFLTPWLAGAWFIVLFAVERFRPLRKQRQPSFARWGLNALAVVIVFATAAVTVGPAARMTLNLVAVRQIGILHLLKLPPPLAMVTGLLLMDLSFYYWHRLNHVVPLLWRFHTVHHIDPELDSTTSFRFHFGEIAYSTGFRFVQLLVIGPSLLTFAVYEALFICGTLFHHSNIRMPLHVERLINKVFVTPRMHGIHHSIIREETNSNYSVVFRWWDRLHSSLRLNVPQRFLRIGVAAYTLTKDNDAQSLLTLPFRKQRHYWQTPDGRPSHKRERKPASPPSQLAN